MKQIQMLILIVITAATLAGCAYMEFMGDYIVEKGKTLRGDLLVTSGSVVLEEDSHVTGSIYITSGSMTMGANSRVDGDVLVTSGSLSLEPGAVIHGVAILTSGQASTAEGANIEGGTNNFGRFLFNTFVPLFGLLCCLPVVLLLLIVWGVVILARGRLRPPAGIPGS